MAEWSIAAVLKTVELRGSWGSNPYLSANAFHKTVIFGFVIKEHNLYFSNPVSQLSVYNLFGLNVVQKY